MPSPAVGCREQMVSVGQDPVVMSHAARSSKLPGVAVGQDPAVMSRLQWPVGSSLPAVALIAEPNTHQQECAGRGAGPFWASSPVGS